MKNFFLPIVLLSLFPSFLPQGEAAVPVLKIRHWSDVEYTRIVIDLGEGSAIRTGQPPVRKP